MKVWIGTDMEGVAGVIGRQHTGPDGHRYEQACKWLTEEVNAVVRACTEAEATEVVVADTHGTCNNILRELLHPAAKLLNGKIASLPYSGVEGLDGSFDCVFLVGYHVRAGRHPGNMDHTAWAQTVSEVRINDQPVGETELVSGYAGSLGVPVLMVAGDDILASDLEETMPAVKTVAVKKAISRHQAVHDSPDSVYEQLEAGAREALQQKEELPPYRFETPTTIELVFKHPTYAELAEMVPLCERTGLNTVAFTGEDYAGELYPAFCSMCGISAIAYYQGS